MSKYLTDNQMTNLHETRLMNPEMTLDELIDEAIDMAKGEPMAFIVNTDSRLCSRAEVLDVGVKLPHDTLLYAIAPLEQKG